MGRKTAKDIKGLIEQDKIFMEKLAALNLKLDDVLKSIESKKGSDLNTIYDRLTEGGIFIEQPSTPEPPQPICGGHSHWNGTACECDPGYQDLNGECVPTEQPPEPPAPNPAGVIYDSNVEGKWNDGNSRIVKGHDGDISQTEKDFLQPLQEALKSA